jgi:hypothetical protein
MVLFNRANDWRTNKPEYWLLERKDGGFMVPEIVFKSMQKAEVIAESGRLAKKRPDSVFRIETRTEK